MTKTLGVVMDPIGSISYKKDSTLAMLLEATQRGWTIYYFEQKDLFLRDGIAYGKSKLLNVFADDTQWFEFQTEQELPLASLQLILMRKDPPFDREYIYTTYILEQAEYQGVLVMNKPQSLRDANEKLFTTWFPACCPPTMVTRRQALLRDFFNEHKDIICKPLDAMGGASVFHLQPGDPNASVVFEMLTQHETRYMMAQRFIPEITAGDKRILLIDGEAVPFALARMPSANDWRGNLAAGARGRAQALTPRDRWICEQVGPVLRRKGLYFVGIDVIGNFLTEINVTSPTCIRELDEQCHLNISGQLFDCLEKHLHLGRL